MPRAVAINVGANASLPGFRGPIRPDGRFEYVPIPEREPTDRPVPTYADLAPELAVEIPAAHLETPVHLDPEFAEYPCCERYTYGDEHGVKAGPLSELRARDYVLFYATLRTAGAEPAGWIAPEWGAYLIGGFRLARDPVTPGGALSAPERAAFANNAHLKRESMDARVLLEGDPDASGLFDRAIPLSRPTGGTEPNGIVTELSGDSGRGPWWRRPLRFDRTATADLLKRVGLPPGSGGSPEFADDRSPLR